MELRLASAHWPAGLRGRRLVLCLLVAGLALAVRGPLGVALGVLLTLAVLDAIVPVGGSTAMQADQRFERLVRARRHEERGLRHRRRAHARLDVLEDRVGWASRAERRTLGTHAVAIASIVGTVEEAKAAVFDAEWRPDAASRGHWTRLWMAQARGTSLPPIVVYRVRDAHYVVDGHHRVSVARDQACLTIDAEVIELTPPKA